jgi:hypothetical protein
VWNVAESKFEIELRQKVSSAFSAWTTPTTLYLKFPKAGSANDHMPKYLSFKFSVSTLPDNTSTAGGIVKVTSYYEFYGDSDEHGFQYVSKNMSQLVDVT